MLAVVAEVAVVEAAVEAVGLGAVVVAADVFYFADVA